MHTPMCALLGPSRALLSSSCEIAGIVGYTNLACNLLIRFSGEECRNTVTTETQEGVTKHD